MPAPYRDPARVNAVYGALSTLLTETRDFWYHHGSKSINTEVRPGVSAGQAINEPIHKALDAIFAAFRRDHKKPKASAEL